MIKYEIDMDKKILRVESQGTVLNLASDTLMLVGKLYNALNEEDSCFGEVFKETIMMGVRNDLPVWNKPSDTAGGSKPWK